MEADHHSFPDSDSGHPDLARLEERLRQLPKPRVPPELEAKLMATIPTTAARPQSVFSKTRRWSAGAMIAGTVAGVLFLLLHWQNFDKAQRPNALKNDGFVQFNPPTLAVNDLKETDPCNILPPLPNWA